MIFGIYSVHAGQASEREAVESRLDAVSAERDYYREALSRTHDYWAARDVCAARLVAAGEETRDDVVGFFASPALRECRDGQKAEVARLTANGGE